MNSYRSGVAGVAAGMGLLAFGADFVGGVSGQVLVALTSSGFAWGLGAFLAGRAAGDARRAVRGATALLAGATLLYYLLVLLVSRRWSGGSLADGLSGDLLGLRSVAVTSTVWLVGSLVAGPALGLLGHLVRAGGVGRAASAAGLACGLLSGEGWHAMVAGPPWEPVRLSNPFVYGVGAGALLEVVLPLVVLAWLATAHRLWWRWPALLGGAVAGGLLTALLWYVYDAHRI